MGIIRQLLCVFLHPQIPAWQVPCSVFGGAEVLRPDLSSATSLRRLGSKFMIFCPAAGVCASGRCAFVLRAQKLHDVCTEIACYLHSSFTGTHRMFAMVETRHSQ